MSAIFSKILKKLRFENDISQKELASELGVSQASVNRWENGFEPSMEKLESIAVYFGISVDKLFGETAVASTPKKSGQERALLVAFDKLDEAGRTRLLGYLDSLLETQQNKS